MAVHIIIVGGGIGGLCLAHGLGKAGVHVAVYEKGPRRADPHWLQGYQIHINPNGSRALQECLPAAVWKSVVANAWVPSAAAGLADILLEHVPVRLQNGQGNTIQSA